MGEISVVLDSGLSLVFVIKSLTVKAEWSIDKMSNYSSEGYDSNPAASRFELATDFNMYDWQMFDSYQFRILYEGINKNISENGNGFVRLI